MFLLKRRPYGLYLWHWPLLVITRSLWPPTTGATAFPLIPTVLIAWSIIDCWNNHYVKENGVSSAAMGVSIAAGLMASISSVANRSLNRLVTTNSLVPTDGN